MKEKFIYIFGGLGGLLIGYDQGAISGVLHFITNDLHLSSFEQGMVVSSIIIGAIISCFFGGKIADKYGRKIAMYIFSTLFIIGAIGSGLAFSEMFLLISRIILGLSVGGASVVVPVYLAELAPKSKRGALVAINQLMIVIGILLAYMTSYAVYNFKYAWRLTLGLATLPAILLIIGTMFLSESPRFLTLSGKIDDAKKILMPLRNNNVNNVESEIKEIQIVAKRPKGNYKDLGKKILRPALIAGIGVAAATQLSGINAILYYAPKIIGVKDATRTSILFTAIVGIFNLAGTIIGMKIVDKFNRKSMLIGGMFAMFIGYLILSISNFLHNTNMVISLIGSIIVFSAFAITWGILVWVVISELFPLYIRGEAVGVALGTNYTINFLIALFFPVAAEKFGKGVVFTFFVAMTILIILFVKKFVIETSGESLEEIEEKLMGDIE